MASFDVDMAQTMEITEIFHSIQGESAAAGMPCHFIRTAGCNLRCPWCDSAYAFGRGQELSLAAILERLKTFPPCQMVELTGGEPMLQAAAVPLMQVLLDKGYRVLLETNGTLDLRQVPRAVTKIVDIKPPSAGIDPGALWKNLDGLSPHDEVKCVITSHADYAWARDKVLDLGLLDLLTVSFSPVWGEVDARDLSRWILADGLPIRLNLQLHKFIWGAGVAGV